MTSKPEAAETDDEFADVAELGYEQARDELATIVGQLESGAATLEESMRLWERGEALAAHCQQWLDGAQQRIDAMTEDTTDTGEE
ncbi:exodeoxyribonuclease VII small subunit [Flexivirga meconopsidis]|uniref:exodeoxyribonuclease VII small subunit n=1 Tax=Flexivirga meconopsidis TaxID=2977121 RepID=UPI0022400749|nr:exodeoxyribonuclease VII small subunit [Flexivirga meconopsidis]